MNNDIKGYDERIQDEPLPKEDIEPAGDCEAYDFAEDEKMMEELESERDQ